jgi:3-keto-disaccharide hydrolase
VALVYAAIGAVLAMVAVLGILRQSDNNGARAMPDPDEPMLVENFESYGAGQRWLDGEQHGQWRATYDGYGRTEVTREGGYALSLSPRSARDREVTHGGLVTTAKEFEDIDVTAQLRTVRQLRAGTPNPWEVAWLLWHYTDDHHFYSLVLKPNGWELGKEDPAYPGAQRYLATGVSPSFPIGVRHTVRVRQVGDTVTVWANGELLTTHTDNERPYFGGRVGLYTEDAHVTFDSVVVRRP